MNKTKMRQIMWNRVMSQKKSKLMKNQMKKRVQAQMIIIRNLVKDRKVHLHLSF